MNDLHRLRNHLDAGVCGVPGCNSDCDNQTMEDEMSEYYEHNTHGAYCWCNPKIEVMENGNKVIIHNDIKPEEATEMGNILLAIASEYMITKGVNNIETIEIDKKY